MTWTPLSFTDGEILYANSHMNPLQNNLAALAAQESGSPQIDVSSANIDLLISSDFISDVSSINTLVASLFQVDTSTVDNLSIVGSMEYTGLPFYACRAWVNFTGSGTVTIRGSGGVTSVTDNGVADYTANWTSAISNYAPIITCFAVSSEGMGFPAATPFTPGITSLRFRTGYWDGEQENDALFVDLTEIYIAIFV